MNTNLVSRIENALEKNGIPSIRKYAETGTVYLEGEHNGVFFKIRISNHSPLYPCRFKIFIDVYEDKLSPSQIVEEIKKGVESKYYFGREWMEEVERQNRMWIDDDEEIRKREENKKRYEEYLKLWENTDLVIKIQTLPNKSAIKEFAKANGLSCVDVLSIKKGIKRFEKYVNIDFNKKH